MATWTEILRAEYVDGYRVRVWFNDGARKVVDLSEVVRECPAFRPLADPDLFRRFRVTDTLEWEGGRIDIAPEYLYENGRAG